MTAASMYRMERPEEDGEGEVAGADAKISGVGRVVLDAQAGLFGTAADEAQDLDFGHAGDDEFDAGHGGTWERGAVHRGIGPVRLGVRVCGPASRPASSDPR